MEKNSENKQLILNTALTLFSEKGYEGVGVQEICTLSNITKPTLYYYFSSKSGLLSAIIENFGKGLYERLEKAAEYKRDFTKGLRDLLVAEILAAEENPAFFRLHSSLATSSEESEGGKIYRNFSEKIENLFEDFFYNSANEIGNMRSKELLFSRIYLRTCHSVALDIINGKFSEEKKPEEDMDKKMQANNSGEEKKIKFSESVAFPAFVNSIVHAFTYGVVNG